MPTDNQNKGLLASFLEAQLTKERTRLWRNIFFAFLAIIALLNLTLIHNHHPHFGLDQHPLFWPLFGLLVGLVLVFIVKKIIQPLIKRSEDHYADL
jgi:hypothetical protein